MIKRARKISLTVLTAMLMAVTTISPAFAADDVQTTTEVGTKQTTVTYTQDSSFTVTIPKNIVLNTSKEASYDVKVQGDIKGNERITIIPDSTITLNDADGKDAVTGNIKQTKTWFNSKEVNQADGASATGTITANDLTAGDWSGSISFTIGKNQEVIGADIKLDRSNIATYGIAYTGDVEIPEYVIDPDGTEHRIVGIGSLAFNSCTGLTSIIIPNSVTSIEWWAFSDCADLTSITIPDSVTSIGGSAFSNSGITSINIPANVRSIGEKAFAGCSKLTSITVDENNTAYNDGNGQNALIETRTNTLLYGCKDTIIPDTVVKISDYAFCGCHGLTSITIPNSVTSIGKEVFACCTDLTSITIPDSVTSIGDEAFRYCTGLTSITIPNSVTSIGKGVFNECSGLTSVTIPDSVTSIGDDAFYNCSSLTSITIPNSVTSIGRAAFNECSGLTSVTIPDSVTSLGVHAFVNCSGLTSITLSDGVTSIGEYAFVNCKNLASVTYKGQTYTSKSALTTALTDNNVTVGTSMFTSTALTD